MEINNNISNGMSPTTHTQTNNTSAKSSTDISKETPIKPVSTWRNMAEKYNIRSITPEETADLSSELNNAGAISNLEHVLLTYQPLSEGAISYHTQADSNGRRDLIAEFEARIEFAKSNIGSKPPKYIENIERILGYLNKIDAAKGKPLDTIA